MTNIETPLASGKAEAKVKASTLATFVVTLLGMTALQSTVTDMVPALPDWLESPAYALIAALATWLAGYNTRTRPDSLSESTVEAVKAWLAKRAPHPRGMQ